MIENRIGLYSDTRTRPTDKMRRAGGDAPLGDEQRGEDPSVNRLCIMVAELRGEEAAMLHGLDRMRGLYSAEKVEVLKTVEEG